MPPYTISKEPRLRDADSSADQTHTETLIDTPTYSYDQLRSLPDTALEAIRQDCWGRSMAVLAEAHADTMKAFGRTPASPPMGHQEERRYLAAVHEKINPVVGDRLYSEILMAVRRIDDMLRLRKSERWLKSGKQDRRESVLTPTQSSRAVYS